jgi:hypothetical protein
MADQGTDPTEELLAQNSSVVPQPPTLDAIGGLKPYSDTQRFSEGELNEKLHITKYDKFKLSMEQLDRNSPTGSFGMWQGDPSNAGTLQRSFNQWQMEREFDSQGKSKMSPEESAQLYPGVEHTGYAEIDRIRYQEKLKNDSLQALINRGPTTGLPFELGVGLAQGILDPTNYALGMASRAGMAALGIGAKLTPFMKYATAFGANVAEQAPLQLAGVPQLQKEGQDATYGETLKGVAVGAALGTAFHGLIDRVKGKGDLSIEEKTQLAAQEKAKVRAEIEAKIKESEARSMPTDAREKAMRVALAQSEAGQRIDVSPVVDEHRARLDGVMPTGVPDEYNFVPLEQPDGRHFYVTTDAKDGAPMNLGRDYGEGVYASDKRLELGDKHVISIADDARLLNLDTQLTSEDPHGKTLAKAIQDVLGDKFDVHGAQTFSDLLRNIDASIEAGHLSEDTMSRIQDKLKEAGVDGYKFIHEGVDGAPKWNGITLFNDAKASSEGYMPFDESRAVTRDMGDVAQAITDPAKQVYNTPDVEDEVRAAKATPPETDRMQRLKQQEVQSTKMIKQMAEPKINEGETLSPRQKKVQELVEQKMAEIDNQHARDLEEAKTAQELIDCTIKGMT